MLMLLPSCLRAAVTLAAETDAEALGMLESILESVSIYRWVSEGVSVVAFASLIGQLLRQPHTCSKLLVCHLPACLQGV